MLLYCDSCMHVCPICFGLVVLDLLIQLGCCLITFVASWVGCFGFGFGVGVVLVCFVYSYLCWFGSCGGVVFGFGFNFLVCWLLFDCELQ